MDEARRVLERLDRIERLQGAGAPRGVLLAEVRALLAEGEAWVEAEAAGAGGAARALDACRARLAHGGDPVARAAC